jgi:hypothetical protein
MKNKLVRLVKSGKCRVCDIPLKGRSDKVFCSLDCKNWYHAYRRSQNLNKVIKIDYILHRNRTILAEFHEAAEKDEFYVTRYQLTRKGFKFDYFTSFQRDKSGKEYCFIYDYRWTLSADRKYLITKADII